MSGKPIAPQCLRSMSEKYGIAMPRTCYVCEGVIPDDANALKVYCSPACSKRMHAMAKKRWWYMNLAADSNTRI